MLKVCLEKRDGCVDGRGSKEDSKVCFDIGAPGSFLRTLDPKVWFITIGENAIAPGSGTDGRGGLERSTAYSCPDLIRHGSRTNPNAEIDHCLDMASSKFNVLVLFICLFLKLAHEPNRCILAPAVSENVNMHVYASTETKDNVYASQRWSVEGGAVVSVIGYMLYNVRDASQSVLLPHPETQ